MTVKENICLRQKHFIWAIGRFVDVVRSVSREILTEYLSGTEKNESNCVRYHEIYAKNNQTR